MLYFVERTQKPGRPKSPNPKNLGLFVKVTADEREVIRQRAKERKMPVASHMREAAMRRVG